MARSSPPQAISAMATTSLNAIHSWPIPSQLLSAGPATLALRITDRITIPTTGPIGSLD